MTSPWVALLSACGLLYLPGLALLMSVRTRMPFRLGLAPVATAGLLGLLALVYHLCAVPWTLLSVLPGIAVLVALAALAAQQLRLRGLLGGADERPEARRVPPGAAAVSALGGVLALGVVLWSFSRTPMHVTDISSAFDAVFHYNAVEAIRRGGDALPWTALSDMYGGIDAYYPVSFHQLASIVPAGPVVAANATVLALLSSGALATASLAWTVAPRTLPPLQRAVIIAGCTSLTAVFFSVPVMALLMGLWPNAFAATAYPAVLAAVISGMRVIREADIRRRPLLTAVRLMPEALIILGGVWIHPSVGFALVIVAFALAAVAVVRTWRPHRRRALLILVVALGALGVCEIVGATLLRSMALTPKITMGPVTTVLSLLVDRPRITRIHLKTQYVAVPLLLGCIGVVVAIRSRSRTLLLLVALAGCTFVVALGTAYGFLPLSSLANAWYQARERVMPMLTTVVLVLAVAGACTIVSRARSRSPRLGTIVLGLVAVATLAPTVATAVDPARMPAITSLAADRSGTYLTTTVDPEERTFIVASARSLPGDAVVVGLPSDGTSMYYALGGRDVVLPHLGYPSTRTQLAVATRGRELGTDAGVCRTVRSLGSHLYYYRDTGGRASSGPAVTSDTFRGLEDLPAQYLTPVAQSPDGRYRLYALTPPC